MAKHTILFTGHAKLPVTITAHKLYEVIAVSVEVNPDTGEIVAVDCTLATDLARRFVCKLIRGRKLGDGFDSLAECLKDSFHGSTFKALIAAFKIIHEKYLEWQLAQQQGLTAKPVVSEYL